MDRYRGNNGGEGRTRTRRLQGGEGGNTPSSSFPPIGLVQRASSFNRAVRPSPLRATARHLRVGCGAMACRPQLVRGRGQPASAKATGGQPSPRFKSEGWAHQDSNLGQAGYEPAALTAELWARTRVTPNSQPIQLPNFSMRLGVVALAVRSCFTSFLPGTPEVFGSAMDAAACAAPSPRSDECVRASPQSSGRLLRACVRSHRRRRTAS
jgi:hypothetical protein